MAFTPIFASHSEFFLRIFSDAQACGQSPEKTSPSPKDVGFEIKLNYTYNNHKVFSEKKQCVFK